MTSSMTGRSSPPTRTSPTRKATPIHTTELSLAERFAQARRWLRLHRRALSAVLAFVSVFFALRALTAPEAASDAAADAAIQAQIDKDLLEVPIRLSDPAMAELLDAGDVVDVLGARPRGPAAVVATGLLVTATLDTDGGSAFSSDGDGLVVVAATAEQSLALAGAASKGPLSIAVHP